MNKEEIEVLNALKKAVVPFLSLEKLLDKNAQELGYVDHHELLNKTGWMDRDIEEGFYK